MATGNSSPKMQPARLLSLDGGGVRGLCTLIILNRIMEAISEEEKRIGVRPLSDSTSLRPCDYFDLIGGTSTGGLIAILLGRLRLDVPTCIEIYIRMSEAIFSEERSKHRVGGRLFRGKKSRFLGSTLESAIKSILVQYQYDEDEPMFDEGLFGPDGRERREVAMQEWQGVAKEKDGGVEGINGVVKVKSSSGMHLLGAQDKLAVNVEKIMQRPNTTTTARELETVGSKTRIQRVATHAKSSFSAAMGRTSSNEPARSPEHRRLSTTAPNSSVHLGCHTLVVASYKLALGEPKLFKTYDARDQSTLIWQALRATSAAPNFFEEMTFGNPPITYLDGGLGFNNPTAEVDAEAKSIWKHSLRSVGVILSIGTGLQSMPAVKEAKSWLPFGLGHNLSLATAIVQMVTSTARVHHEVQRIYDSTDTLYERFDVDTGLDGVSLEQWMKMDQMGAATEKWMLDQEQRTREFARTIVKLSKSRRTIEISAGRFSVGIEGDGLDLIDPRFPNVPCWLLEGIDVKTGYPSTLKVADELNVSMDTSRPKVKPVEQDLDGDGLTYEPQIVTCTRADKVCLRALISGIPAGRWRVVFILCFWTWVDDGTHDTPVARSFSWGAHSSVLEMSNKSLEPVSENRPVAFNENEHSPSSDTKSATSTSFIRSKVPKRWKYLRHPSNEPFRPPTPEPVVTEHEDDRRSNHSDSTCSTPGAPLPPNSLILSAGTPYNASTFTTRIIDPLISPDIVPVLLHPDAVRTRIDRLYDLYKGQGWIEVEGDVPVDVGFDGNVGIVLSVPWKEDSWWGGWSFGGVRLVPMD